MRLPYQHCRSECSLLILGAVRSYRGLLVCRFFLGALEGMVYWRLPTDM